MLAVSGILGHFFGCIPQFPGAIKDDPVAMVVLDMLGVHAHPVANTVQALLELIRGEKRQAPIRPFPADKALSLKRSGPVDGAASSPG